MPRPLARALLWSAAVLVVTVPAPGASQEPEPGAPGARLVTPPRDPVTVRGCLEKRWLRILQHDATDLSGVTRVRLKGSRAMLALVDDGRGHQVEITGDLDLGRRDRLEARRKHKVGSKTTISVGASAEQVSGAQAMPPEVTLVVGSITRLGYRCPAR